MNTSDKLTHVLKWVLIVILVLVALAGIITIIQAARGGFFDKIACKTDSYDIKHKYELIDVLRELGEAPVYEVKINGSTYKITEDVWQTYLGEENNCVTCHIEKLVLYNDHTFLGFFSTGYSYQEFSKYNYPWEEPSQPFTEGDTNTLIRDIYKNGGWRKRLFHSETTVEFEFTGVGHGTANYWRNLYDVVECESPEINWWWNWFI